MIATVIRIPEEEYLLYKDLARKRKESLAEFFRKSARRQAGFTRGKKKKYSIFNIGTKVVSKGGPKDGSVNADKYYYLYEEGKMRNK